MCVCQSRIHEKRRNGNRLSQVNFCVTWFLLEPNQYWHFGYLGFVIRIVVFVAIESTKSVFGTACSQSTHMMQILTKRLSALSPRLTLDVVNHNRLSCQMLLRAIEHSVYKLSMPFQMVARGIQNNQHLKYLCTTIPLIHSFVRRRKNTTGWLHSELASAETPQRGYEHCLSIVWLSKFRFKLMYLKFFLFSLIEKNICASQGSAPGKCRLYFMHLFLF